MSSYPIARETPMMLLPNNFFNEKGEKINCKNREIYWLFSKMYELGPFNGLNRITKDEAQSNICDFTTPIEIKSKSSLILKPELYATNFGLAGTSASNIFNGADKEFVKTNIDSLGGQVGLIPKGYEEYDDISNKNTFNIGGFILTDTRKADILNSTLKIRDKNNKAVKIKIGNLSYGALLIAYKIPNEPFTPAQNIFDSNILGMQVFWYLNDFWSANNITGKYDAKTAEMLKRFQRETKIAETGKFDDATMFVVKAFKRNVSYYENYGDEEVTISFDAPQQYFRLFSIGEWDVWLNDDTTSSSYMIKVADKTNCSRREECRFRAFTFGGRNLFTLSGITILNNTPETKECVIMNPNNIQIDKFQIAPNEMHRQEEIMENVSAKAMHRLQCGNKYLDLELSPIKSIGG